MRRYRRIVITRVGAVAAGLAATLAVAGCAQRTVHGATTYETVTVTPSADPSVPSSPVAAVRSSSAPVVVMRKLPGTCDSLLNLGTVVDALGHPVAGDTAFVVGTGDAATGRVSYLNCRYGVSKKAPDGTIEIGVSLYRSAARAAARIAPTVTDFEQHGAAAAKSTTGGLSITLLTGGRGAGYGPTAVLADGQRTIAVTAPGATATELQTLATLAARRTAGP